MESLTAFAVPTSSAARSAPAAAVCALHPRLAAAITKHGKCGSREYSSWVKMVRRCVSPRDNRFKDYGGRGIRVCDRWRYGEGGRHPFECFLADMGERAPGLTIERVDNDGNYEKANCIWADPATQARNTRRTLLTAAKAAEIRALAGQLSPAEIADSFGASYSSVWQVLKGRTWRARGPQVALMGAGS
jgi:hypothetical protein